MSADDEYDLRCTKCQTEPPETEAEFIAFWGLTCPGGGTHEMPDVVMSPAERRLVEEYESKRAADGSHPWEVPS